MNQSTSQPPSKKCKLTHIRNDILNILQKVSDLAPYQFVVSGELDNAPSIQIFLKNIDSGRIYLPIVESEASRIIRSCEQSPYGRGSETVVDTSVRNSWQVEPNNFEISSPNWNTYMNDVLLPRIKKEMFIEYNLSQSLYKLLLYTPGSFFRPHRDSEKEDRMFATLVIELPSKYTGGQIVVRHDGKAKTVDFSSKVSTFFTVFYADCEHEVLPITSGYRLCLIYNLISQKTDSVSIAPDTKLLETEFITFMKGINWSEQSKLVYSLKHMYSEANLSFETLKMEDFAVAIFLKRIAVACDLDIHLGLFCTKDTVPCDNDDDYSYYSYSSRSYYDSDFTSSDDDFYGGAQYILKNLVSVDSVELLRHSNLNVEFENEVITQGCFKNLEPYDMTVGPTGNEGIQKRLFYETAAIAVWPKKFAVQVLKKGMAASIDIDKRFLKEFLVYQNEKDEELKIKLLAWANVVLGRNEKGIKSVDVVNAIIELENLDVIQKLFYPRFVTPNETTVGLLVSQCDKYGWSLFAGQITSMFKKICTADLLSMFQLLIGDNVRDDKLKVCRSVFPSILNKFTDKVTPYRGYVRPPTAEDRLNKRKEDQDALLSISISAQKLDFDLLEYSKTKSIILYVPVLIRLVPDGSDRLDKFWLNIANHFLREMEVEAAAQMIVPNWQRTTKSSCACGDCATLNSFLGSSEESINLKLDSKRRKHLHIKMNAMEEIFHETDRTDDTLVIKKTLMTGYTDMELRDFCIKILKKFRSIIPC